MFRFITGILLASAILIGITGLVSGPSGVQASASVSHKLPSWVHWAWASKSARVDCHGGPAIILWVGDSDQSALVCKKDAAIWPPN